MEEEILFYGDVDDFTVSSFILRLQNATRARKDIDLLVNTSGGDVFAGWGMVAQWRKFSGNKAVTVHGNCSSMGAVFLIYADKKEGIQQSKYVLHRASAFFETGTTGKLVREINKDMRAAFEEGLDIEKFEEIGGVTLDRFFDVDQDPVDVVLNADQAKAIGLIKNIISLTPNEVEAINERSVKASMDRVVMLDKAAPSDPPKPKTEPKKSAKMTVEELKEKHPEVYASIYGKGKEAGEKDGAKIEADRVAAWAVWNEIDPEGVAEGIKSGEPITTAKTQEFLKVQAKNQIVAQLESEEEEEEEEEGPTIEEEEEEEEEGVSAKVKTTKKVSTPKAKSKKAASKKEQTIKGFDGEVREILGLNKKAVTA